MNNQRKGPRPDEIGAAWIKEGKFGKYVSIQFNDQVKNFDLANCFIDMYVNEKKTNPKAPDYRIRAREKQAQGQRQAPQAQPSRFPAPKNTFPQSGGGYAGPDDEDPGF